LGSVPSLGNLVEIFLHFPTGYADSPDLRYFPSPTGLGNEKKGNPGARPGGAPRGNERKVGKSQRT